MAGLVPAIHALLRKRVLRTARTTKDTGKRPLVIRVLAVADPARTPFLGARALFVISDLQRRPSPGASVLAETFGLTPAETRLASTMATGISIGAQPTSLVCRGRPCATNLKAVFEDSNQKRRSLVATLKLVTPRRSSPVQKPPSPPARTMSAVIPEKRASPDLHYGQGTDSCMRLLLPIG
jgi:hypothetical protein